MRRRPKKNNAVEESYVRDLERRGPLERVEQGESQIVSPEEYPDPIKRFLERERRTVRVRLSPTTQKRLERLSHATGVGVDELARRWVGARDRARSGIEATPLPHITRQDTISD